MSGWLLADAAACSCTTSVPTIEVEGLLAQGRCARGAQSARAHEQSARAHETTHRVGLVHRYYVEAESWNEKERILTLKKLDLVEVSIVTFPANPEARIDAVKTALAHGKLPTLREFEAVLREHGFSKA